MADAEQIAEYVLSIPGVEWSGLVASPNGAKRAIGSGLRTIEYVVSAADGHSQVNARRSTQEAVDAVAEVGRIVHDAGGRLEVIIATAWDCPFDGPTDPERTASIAARAVELGADQLCFGDTIGTTTPVRVWRLFDAVRAAIGGAPGADPVPLGAHFHNTRGTGIASAFAAVQAGVTQLDASVGGLGGCPFAPGASGNIATEELVYLLDDAAGTGRGRLNQPGSRTFDRRQSGRPFPGVTDAARTMSNGGRRAAVTGDRSHDRHAEP
jgi:hydroxymethylglutaryl-CoA lyase